MSKNLNAISPLALVILPFRSECLSVNNYLRHIKPTEADLIENRSREFVLSAYSFI